MSTQPAGTSEPDLQALPSKEEPVNTTTTGFTDDDVQAVTGCWIYARIQVLGDWYSLYAQVHRAWISQSTPGALAMWVTRHHPTRPDVPSYLVVCAGEQYELVDGPR